MSLINGMKNMKVIEREEFPAEKEITYDEWKGIYEEKKKEKSNLYILNDFIIKRVYFYREKSEKDKTLIKCKEEEANHSIVLEVYKINPFDQDKIYVIVLLTIDESKFCFCSLLDIMSLIIKHNPTEETQSLMQKMLQMLQFLQSRLNLYDYLYHRNNDAYYSPIQLYSHLEEIRKQQDDTLCVTAPLEDFQNYLFTCLNLL